MKEQVIIRKYASALVESFADTEYDNLLEDINCLEEVFKSESKLPLLLESHLIDKKKKDELLQELTGKLKNQEIWNNFFLLLIKNSRCLMILYILSSAREIIYEKQNKLELQLTFAREQSQETLDEIMLYLKNKLNKEIVADIKYDQSVIGGFRAETLNMIIDGSIQNNLKRFVQASKKKSS